MLFVFSILTCLNLVYFNVYKVQTNKTRKVKHQNVNAMPRRTRFHSHEFGDIALPSY